MKGVTFLIEKLVTTTYKKLGINGILLLLIFIAIPASLYFCFIPMKCSFSKDKS